MNKEYTNESIKSLKGADRVRKRPGVIFGSDDLEGCIHSFFEILSNSTDEARAGHGTQINVEKHKDGSITVEDFGRGVPMDYNRSEKRYNWELIYDEMYAGGKYDADSMYKYSLGLNGLGACATQYASRWFKVVSARDGYEFEMNFKKGKPSGELIKKKTSRKQTGTKQTWLPDSDVFTDTNIPAERIDDILKKQAIVNAGVRYTFKDELTDTDSEYFYPEGILGYANEICGEDKNLIVPPFLFSDEGKGKDRADKTEYKVVINAAIGFSNDSQVQEFYHNSSPLEYGGAPKKAMETSLLTFFNDACRKKNLLPKKSDVLNIQDIRDCLVFISNTFSTETSYENQTKKSITNRFIEDYMTAVVLKNMKKWSEENSSDFDRVCKQLSVNMTSRVSAETQRIVSKKKLTSKLGITDRVKNFCDCRSKDAEKRELFIVEGLSALGSAKMARDSEYQAVMAIRGKILNCLKVDASTIFKSDIIMDIIKVLGCGIELSAKKGTQSFDISKLRFGKIIIFTDQDVDGFHIQTLVLTALYRLCPTLIREGKVYVGETPLYEITCGSETFFAYSDKEKDEISLKHKNAKVSRNKGLGEVDPETLHQTSMDPANRRLIRVEMDDVEVVAETFELFMGLEIPPRKEFIEKNGHLYCDDLDLD